MEPPATPRRPKRSAKETPETPPEAPEGGETPAKKPRSSRASTPAPAPGTARAPKPAPKPRATKKAAPSTPPAQEAAPPTTGSPAAEAASVPVIRPAKELTAATPAAPKPEEHGPAPSTPKIPGLPSPPSRAAKTFPAGEATKSAGDRLVAISRTLALRNMELARRYGTRATHAVRESASRLSERLPKREAAAPGTTGPGSNISAQVSNTGRQIGQALDRSFDYTERRLRESDAAVIALTLVLILACLVLGALAYYLWTHY